MIGERERGSPGAAKRFPGTTCRPSRSEIDGALVLILLDAGNRWRAEPGAA
jgi:hypothetical protein